MWRHSSPRRLRDGRREAPGLTPTCGLTTNLTQVQRADGWAIIACLARRDTKLQCCFTAHHVGVMWLGDDARQHPSGSLPCTFAVTIS
jgi:hypothetical protein